MMSEALKPINGQETKQIVLSSEEREGMINSMLAFHWTPQAVLEKYDDERIIYEYDRMMKVQ